MCPFEVRFVLLNRILGSRGIIFIFVDVQRYAILTILLRVIVSRPHINNSSMCWITIFFEKATSIFKTRNYDIIEFFLQFQ